MNLSIKVINKEPEIFEGKKYCLGEIQIGAHKEKFRMRIDYWNIKDYEKQWEDGLARLKAHNTSCLINSFQDPKLGMYITFWSIHKNDKLNKIYVREQLIIEDILEDLINIHMLPKELKNKEFNSQTCYNFIVPRNPNSNVDEWETDLI